jgi:predicted MFS family arabinose efflux permease
MTAGWRRRRLVVRTAVDTLFRTLGGPARTRVVLLLAAVLGLNAADLGVLGAVARQLQVALDLNHAQLGLLGTVSSGVGALASLPMGALADVVVRVRLLVVSILLWSLALGLGAFATAYPWLLLSRVALGGAAAASGPLLASLTGDLFPVGERAKVYGWLLTGEMAGAGVGLLAGANLAAFLSWRWAFWLLAVLGSVLAWAVYRFLPEPARGGASRMPPGARTVPNAAHVRLWQARAVDRHRAGRDDRPVRGSLWSAFRYVLRTPTIRQLIVASAVGYFFFAGARTFGVVFVERQYGVTVGQLTGFAVVVGAGALAGAVLGGRVADGLRHGGLDTARVVVPAVAYAGAALLFTPALLTTSVWLSLPLYVGAASMLAAANPPLDAARLDLVPAPMWGRAEAVRTVLRLGAEALAPLAFGLLADALRGPAGRHTATGLRETFSSCCCRCCSTASLSFAPAGPIPVTWPRPVRHAHMMTRALTPARIRHRVVVACDSPGRRIRVSPGRSG